MHVGVKWILYNFNVFLKNVHKLVTTDNVFISWYATKSFTFIVLISFLKMKELALRHHYAVCMTVYN